MTAFALVCRASMVAPRTGSEFPGGKSGLWEYETSPSHGAKSLNPGVVPRVAVHGPICGLRLALHQNGGPIHPLS